MSLYNHVAHKDDLLDGMVDEVFAEIGAPPDRSGWRAAMEDRAHTMRAVLKRHRWAVGVMDSRTTPGPANLHHHDTVLGCLRRAGFSIRLAGHAYAALDAYIYGFVLQELTLPFQGADRTTDVAGPMLDAMPVDRYPHLVELATDVVMRPDYDFGDEFPYGLALVLDGLERAMEEQ